MKQLLQIVRVALCALFTFSVINKATAQDDLTAKGGILTVFRENDGGKDVKEGSPSVIDNDAGTKFLSHWPDAQWLQYQLTEPAAVGTYTLVSADDAPERDPKNWKLEGSNNGTTWIELDSRTGETFSERFQTKTYHIGNTTPYTYYRLNISALNGAGTFQLAEWRLFEAVQNPDITARGGVLTVFKENDRGQTADEGSPKVIDNNSGSKFLSNWPGEQWMRLQLTAPATVGTYILISANDDPNRDPKDWKLEGSQNGTDWTVLDTRTGEMFTERFQTKAYTIANNTAYAYYRLNISAIKSGGTFQLAEWRLFEGDAIVAPSALTAFSTAGDEVHLTWTDFSVNETGFEVERSLDGTNFAKIATVTANTKVFFDRNLTQNTKYYYRVRTIGAELNSSYSVVSSTRTLNYSGAMVDLTDNGGKLTVSVDNGNPEREGSSFFIDNSSATKYLAPAKVFWAQYKSTASNAIVTKYVIVSANDFPDRDPKDWTFQGSKDGTTWTVLDTRKNQVFTGRFQENAFSFKNNETYEYFKLDVTANNGSSGTQMSEWQIWGIPQNAPAVPSNFNITNPTESTLTLSWSDVANETEYEIWRSTDGATFTRLNSVTAGTTTYTDTNLGVLATYQYRVKAISASGNSIFSPIISGTTLYDERLPLPAENLVATTLSENQVKLDWVDKSENETEFQIERSTNGTSYALLQTVAADVTTYTDERLQLATRYYYRIRPINEYSQSSGINAPYSSVAETITSGSNQAPTLAAIADQKSCNVVDAYTLPLEGLASEPGQQLSLSVTTNRSALFSELSVSKVENGKATLKYKLVKGQPGEATVTVTVKDDGGTLNNGTDTFTRTFKITSYELNMSIAANRNEKVPRGETIQLTVTGEEGYTYTWADGPGIISGQNSNVLSIKPTQGYVYKVTASTAEGCTREAQFTVQVEGGVKLQANNILTPNGDGKNDVWVIWNINTYPGSKLRVFDTAGRVVYETENYANDWNGTYNGSPLAQGVYYYVIDLGSGISPAKGALTILRD
ncbi:gliding motility-associated C-terminal domain-containing protein [Rufibacter sediminis]|uniref:Gliding motility-associated C-terminal domain-containing protein n=1 Tax=Rufibacter sediminis TaxID=2762756 RepID=A0ABR6VSY8_9BACT|nr:gliding motility-associated C-terminal domain-containing protein [Rufibacter sediminis]MBC3540039.1 gliding motility-associated C-terminal domain-containing protein [Rufibacter sediminis]